jgi:hypothetical protein
VKVYEVLQFNKAVEDWFIVGDCSENKRFIESEVELHNLKLK